MKTRNFIFVLSLFFFSSCGALRVKPTGCLGEGQWSSLPSNTELKNSESEIILSQNYYVWLNDYEVRLKDFLKNRNIDCRKISRMHINMKSVFFVKRELRVFVQK